MTAQLTLREEVCEKPFIVAVVHVCVVPEHCGWRPLRQGDALLMRRLVQKLIHVVLVPWRSTTCTVKTSQYSVYYFTVVEFTVSGHTFKKIDSLFPMVTRGRKSKRCVHMIRDFVKAHADVTRIVLIQFAVIEPPVLVSLLKLFPHHHSCGLTYTSQMIIMQNVSLHPPP